MLEGDVPVPIWMKELVEEFAVAAAVKMHTQCAVRLALLMLREMEEEPSSSVGHLDIEAKDDVQPLVAMVDTKALEQPAGQVPTLGFFRGAAMRPHLSNEVEPQRSHSAVLATGDKIVKATVHKAVGRD